MENSENFIFWLEIRRKYKNWKVFLGIGKTWQPWGSDIPHLYFIFHFTSLELLKDPLKSEDGKLALVSLQWIYNDMIHAIRQYFNALKIPIINHQLHKNFFNDPHKNELSFPSSIFFFLFFSKTLSFTQHYYQS